MKKKYKQCIGRCGLVQHSEVTECLQCGGKVKTIIREKE